MRNVIVYNL